jgi:molybdopterin-containing oxidoreductase family membrane subunit
LTDREEKILYPLRNTSKSFYVFLAALSIVSLWFLYAYYIQLNYGLAVTSLSDVVIWGVYISNFIFFVGLSHAGIAISAAVKILKLDNYKPIVRIAELLTIVSLAMAGLSIVIDLGRPDRAFLLITSWTSRIGTSPLIWDITAVATYLILSATYLYISLREDIHKVMMSSTGWRKKFYSLCIPWYDEDETPTVHRLSRWMAVTILPVMVMVHTTVAWIFGLISSRPLWFGGIAGPYFVAGAIVSGIAAVIAIAAILRSLFHWQDIIKPQIFRGLGNFLAIMILIYLWFLLSEQMTANYAGPSGENIVSQEWLFGSYSGIFWPMLLGGMVLPCIILLWQAFKPGYVNINLTAILAGAVVLAFWVKRYLVIIPTMTRGLEGIVYTPSWVEVSIVIGTFALPALMYTLFVKFFPIIELEEVKHD